MKRNDTKGEGRRKWRKFGIKLKGWGGGDFEGGEEGTNGIGNVPFQR